MGVFKKHTASVILGLVITGYLLLRIFIAPLSDDEYITYREHVVKDVVTILTSGNPDIYWAPNNHILNTLFIKLSVGIFGEHDWALRLHVVLAFIVCFYFMFRNLSKFVESPARVTAYLGILFLNPYLLDFFSIARGYALSFAGWSAAVFYFINYYREPSVRSLRNTLISLFIAVWSNFSAVYFLPLFGLMFLYSFYKNRKERYVNTHFVMVSTGLLAIAAIIAVPLTKALAAGTLTWGTSSFFQDTFVASVDYYQHYNVHMMRFDRFGENWSKTEVATVVLMVFWVLAQIIHFRLPAGEKIQKIHFIALFQCTGIVVIVWLLHAFFGTAYPYHRTALLYGFPMLLCLFAALENIVSHFKITNLLVYGMFAFCAWHSACSWNVENTMEWYQNGDAKRVFSYLKDEVEKEKPGEKIVLGAEQWQYFSMAFYAETTYKDMVILKFTNMEKEEKFDYLFVPPHLKDSVWAGYHPVKEFVHGILFEYRASPD